MDDSRISDLIIRNDEMTTEEFAKLLRFGKPAGYSQFVKFINGDYTYEDAKFKVRMLSETDNDKLRLEELKLTIDVVDITETGSGSIGSPASSGESVTFTKTFHAAPEVTVSWQSGTGTPKIGVAESVTTTGFTAYLKDTANTDYEGNFTWAARGY